MYIPQGKIVAVQIIVAVIAQGMGGFLLNQKTVTSCESQFDYSTDVYGAFTGDGQDIPVDFNPRENVTGYYAMDPTDPGTGQEQKRQPAIYYDSAKQPNNYPYQRQATVSATYTLTIECTKALNNYKDPETYNYTLIQQTEEGQIKKEGSWQGGDMTKYSGLYETSVGYITHSYIYINGALHEALRILNIQDMMSHIDELKDKDLSLILENGGSYPTFLANLDYNADVGLFHRSYEFYYNSEISTYAYVETGTATTEIHIQNYKVSDSWLVFGSEHDGDRKITLTVIAFEPDKENIYIDPNKGVAPAHQSTSYTEWHDEYFYPATLTGSMDNGSSYIISTGQRTFEHKFVIQVGMITEPGNPEQEVKWYDQAYIEFKGHGQSDTQTSATITFTNPDDPDHPTSINTVSTGSTQMVYFRLNWTIDHEKIHMYAVELGQEMTVDYSHDYLKDAFASYTFKSVEGTSQEYAYAHMELTIADTYTDSSLPTQSASFNGKSTENPTVKIDNTYNIKHISEEIPFESDQTYWYNGYNNSTIGMIVSCLPIPGASGDVPAETKFNVMLHMTDLTDRWCYNDVLKPAISVWTDKDTGMVYVGRYDSDGARLDDSAMQVGVCSYAYFELRVVSGALTLWIAPVYQYSQDAPFMDFTPEPLFDQTAAIMGVAPTGSSVKSITQLSFNVQTIKTAVQNNVQTVTQQQQDMPAMADSMSNENETTWVSGDCIVHAYDITNRIEVTGSGAMADYASQDDVPWKGYYVDSIVIHDGVTHIGDYAFCDCNAKYIYGIYPLVEAISVTSIGKNAFSGCQQLERVVFTDNLTSIGSYAFDGCISLASVKFGSSVTSIGQYAFYNCRSLASVTIPDSVTSIGSETFNSCISLASVTIGSSVTSIGHHAFYHCTAITSVTIPNSVETIGWAAFDGCTSLASVKFGSSVTSIGQQAFWKCTSLTTIVFQVSEWNITLGDSAFDLSGGGQPVHADVYSYNNCAEDKLGTYPNVTFTYHSLLMPVYPRQLVTHTVILLDGGGMYKENAELTLNQSFPNDALTELVINAVVHPGDSMSLITHKEIDGETVEVVMADLKNDGVDKWIYKDQYYDWWDLQIYYVSNHIGDVEIDGHHYSGGMYLGDGTRLEANHVYLHIGKYGLYEDLGEMGKVDGRSDLTIRMNGIWAFSTQYYLGTNVQGSKIAFDEAGIWNWSWNETLVVFAMVMLAVSVVLFYKFGFNIYDILFMGGALALLWVSFQG